MGREPSTCEARENVDSGNWKGQVTTLHASSKHCTIRPIQDAITSDFARNGAPRQVDGAPSGNGSSLWQ